MKGTPYALHAGGLIRHTILLQHTTSPHRRRRAPLIGILAALAPFAAIALGCGLLLAEAGRRGALTFRQELPGAVLVIVGLLALLVRLTSFRRDDDLRK